MASIRFNEWKFIQENDGIWIAKHDKVMNMYEWLKKFTLKELTDHIDKDLTFTHNNKTYTVNNLIIHHAVVWAKEA
jgi:hypothetical protein